MNLSIARPVERRLGLKQPFQYRMENRSNLPSQWPSILFNAVNIDSGVRTATYRINVNTNLKRTRKCLVK